MLIKCRQCGNEFDTTKTKQKIYCCRQCSITYNNAHRDRYAKPRKRNPVMAVCEICGNRFESTYSGKKYCSDECKKIAKQTHDKPLIDKICEQCGKEFKTIWSNSKYCCQKCRMDAATVVKQMQLCWNCQRYCGSNACEWATDGTPIKGWIAEPSKIHSDGYRIRWCPEFMPDPGWEYLAEKPKEDERETK